MRERFLLNCARCGAEVERRARQKFSVCFNCKTKLARELAKERHKQNLLNNGGWKECEWCFKAFRPPHKTSKFCSRVCSQKGNPPPAPMFIIPLTNCKNCDVRFKPSHREAVFCSQSCSAVYNFQHLPSNLRRRVAGHQKICYNSLMRRAVMKKADLNSKAGKFLKARHRGLSKKDSALEVGIDPKNVSAMERTQVYQATLKKYFKDEFLQILSVQQLAEELKKNVIQDEDRGAKNAAIKIALDKLEPDKVLDDQESERVSVILVEAQPLVQKDV